MVVPSEDPLSCVVAAQTCQRYGLIYEGVEILSNNRTENDQLWVDLYEPQSEVDVAHDLTLRRYSLDLRGN